jgi:hypothetical protein
MYEYGTPAKGGTFDLYYLQSPKFCREQIAASIRMTSSIEPLVSFWNIGWHNLNDSECFAISGGTRKLQTEISSAAIFPPNSI